METINYAALVALMNDPAKAFQDNPRKALCTQQPHEKWRKRNKFANNSEYLPIDKVEFLLDVLFEQWNVEITSVDQHESNVTVAVRVNFQDRHTKEWGCFDGIASEPLKRDALTDVEKATFDQILGAISSERNVIERAKIQQAYYQLKKSRPVKEDAVKGAFQIAKSNAIKDATDHLGALFGRDLNRKDTIYINYEEVAPQAYEQPKVKVQHTEEPAPVQQAPTEEPTFTLF